MSKASTAARAKNRKSGTLKRIIKTVSYTHLTLPTNREV